MTGPASERARLDALLESARRAARAGAAAHPDAGRLSPLLDAEVAPAAVAPATTPVVESHLPAALEAARAAGNPLAGALAAARRDLRWISTYRDDAGAGEMASGYASALLVGTGAPLRDYQPPFTSPRVMVAITLQRPALHYPTHRHAASEVYHVVAGRAQWQRGEEPWRWREPGEWFFHESGQGHAMRTHREPLLTLAAWIDHLDAPPPTLAQAPAG